MHNIEYGYITAQHIVIPALGNVEKEVTSAA